MTKKTLVLVSVGLALFMTTCRKPGAGLLSYMVASTVESECTDGMTTVDIYASGGVAPYQFYVIPEGQWASGDNMQDRLEDNDVSLIYRYAHSKGTVPARGGTADHPAVYWVAVQDVDGSAAITGTNMMSWWKKISVVCK